LQLTILGIAYNAFLSFYISCNSSFSSKVHIHYTPRKDSDSIGCFQFAASKLFRINLNKDKNIVNSPSDLKKNLEKNILSVSERIRMCFYNHLYIRTVTTTHSANNWNAQ
jgi:hypothetical protein